MKKRIFSYFIIATIFTSMIFQKNVVCATNGMDVWTSSSYINVFQDFLKGDNASESIELVVARNEYESSQILLRSSSAFTIQGVTFTNLIKDNDIIDSCNLKYNFVEYEYLSANSPNISYPIRKAPGKFPEALSNEPTIDVPANTTQPVWVTAYIPKDVSAGSYSGDITINTSIGEYQVPITLEVNDVTIPDSDKGEFEWVFWTQLTGYWSKSENDLFNEFYNVERFSPQWWEIMGNIADQMKAHRHNVLFVSTPVLLLDGGTYIDETTGDYVFNWSKFDEFIEFFMDKKVVKKIFGHAILKSGSYDLFAIKKNEEGKYISHIVPYSDPLGKKWLDQYIPALVQHLKEKGWDDIWWQSIGDEPSNITQKNRYKNIHNKINSLSSGIKFGDAYYDKSLTNFMEQENVDIHVPVIYLYEKNVDTYQNIQDSGKDVFMYTMLTPRYDWLNRFVDLPNWTMRTIGWLSYKRNVKGHLHWGWNAWRAGEKPGFRSIDEVQTKGDSMTVHPDPDNLTIKSSIRYEACRDAAEDYELFKILEQLDIDAAKDLAGSIVTNGNVFSHDTDYMIEQRNLLVRQAAGKIEYNPLSGYWKFDEITGNIAKDSSNRNHDGITTEGTTWVAEGKKDRAIRIDSEQDGTVELPFIVNPMNDFTASMWIKLEEVDGTNSQVILQQKGAGRTWLYRKSVTGKLGTYITGKEIKSNTDIEIGKWHQVVIVHENGTIKMYTDGMLTGEELGKPQSCTDTMLVGKNKVSNSINEEWNGLIDELRIYDKALTDVEIKNLYDEQIK